MPIAVLVPLLTQFGLPLTQQIYAWIQAGKTTVTPEDFATLVALSQYRSTDALTAAGIQIVDGKVISLPAKTA